LGRLWVTEYTLKADIILQQSRFLERWYLHANLLKPGTGTVDAIVTCRQHVQMHNVGAIERESALARFP
jgi:hypothetical protein